MGSTSWSACYKTSNRSIMGGKLKLDLIFQGYCDQNNGFKPPSHECEVIYSGRVFQESQKNYVTDFKLPSLTGMLCDIVTPKVGPRFEVHEIMANHTSLLWIYRNSSREFLLKLCNSFLFKLCISKFKVDVRMLQ